MKKFFTLFSMMFMLAFTSQAGYYIVGNAPFGDWNPGAGVEMSQNADGTYSYTATISGSVWFVFADGLDANWDTFNTNYRFGPAGADVEVGVDTWYDTPRGGDKSYKFTGSGGEYVFTFNPFIKKFKIEGYVAPFELENCTVAGIPTSIFGTEWDKDNEANLMTKQADGTYILQKFGCELGGGTEVAFKIVGNHDWGSSWPSDNVVVPIEESGLYDCTFTFNPDGNVVGYEFVSSGSFEVLTGELYILGEANGNTWDPCVGVKMDTEDQNVFTAEITTAGENLDENDGNNYSFFSFTTKLAENAGEWSSIAAYRLGATEDGYPLSDDMLGVEIGLSNFGSTNSFKIPAGTYNVTVNLENKTMVVEKAEEPIVPEVGYKIEKIWSVDDLSFVTTNDARQGFGMNSKFYVNDKANQTILVVGKNGVTETTYPGGANCGITRDEAGNIVVSNAAFPGGWTEATIKVINPQTNEEKEYTVPEECGLLGRCDFIGFAKGNLMEDGALYLTGGNTGTDPFTNGVAVLTIAGGEVATDECYTATCDGLVGQTSTVINYYKDLNEEDAMIYAYRSGNPSKLMFDGDALVATPIVLPGKGHCNGIFPFIWEGKEYFIYPTMPDYQDGFAVAEAGAEEPIVEVASTVAANANVFQADWFNAEVDDFGVTIYQYYPGGHMTVYRLTNNTGGIEELIVDTEKVVAGVRYYNIMGQEMTEANGLTIIVTTYTDGSHSAIKVIK